MVSIKLYLFASLRDLFSEESEIDMILEKTCWTNADELKLFLLNELKNKWIERQKVLKVANNDQICNLELPRPATIMLTINEYYVDNSSHSQLNLSDKTIIALIPPVSGG